MDFPFLDIVFFAMLAIFLGLRLRNVLGRRTGLEKRRPDPFKPAEPAAPQPADNVLRLPERDRKALENIAQDADTPLARGVKAIHQADPSFDEAGFVGGARGAFEMIVTAFAKGDLSTLRPLLADGVFDNFKRAIDDRASRGETLETTLVGVNAAEMVDADLDGSTAKVTIRFVSEQVNVTRSADGKVVDGDANKVVTITDVWTFARDVRSRDPNWALVETRAS
ncbi:MAG: Tim44 domain-containing protein [Alphaproteobacteria bacterium]|nr:Tim44 domain-containing protein [Alphaproteobacteria bacterium]